jgi:hypothetical protein
MVGSTRRRASRRELWLIALVLTVVAAGIYGPHVVDGGFTIDDWSIALAAEHPRTGSVVRDFWEQRNVRPGLVLYIPATHAVLGPNPELHIALAIAMAVLMSLALYAVLRRVALAPLHAGAISVLVMLFPWASSARFWAVAGLISFAIAVGLAGVLVALRGLDERAAGNIRRGRALHAGALVLYAVSLLTYDITTLALLLAGLLYLTRARWPVVRLRWGADIVVVLACIALNQLKLDRERYPLAEMLDHARAIADGAATVFARAAYPFGTLGRQTILVGLAVVVISAVAVRLLMPPSNDARPALTRWIALAGSGVLLAAVSWALFVPAHSYYHPASQGVGNRVNVMAAIGVVIAVYAVLGLIAILLLRGVPSWKRGASILTAALAAVLLVGYAREVRDEQQAWARASASTDEVLATIERTVPSPPDGSTIYTFGHPGGERAGVSIFGYQWDLDGAVGLLYDTPELNAYPMLEGVTMSCEEEGVGPEGGDWSPELYGARYGTAYFVDVASSSAERIDSRSECVAAQPRFLPGPAVR